MNDRHQQQAPDDVALLLEYLRGRDAPCPRCGYNLRDLQLPRCPECREELSLAVGFRKARFGWFLATVTPGLFSGMCAAFLLVPMVMIPQTGGGPPPWPVFVADAFGWTSGLAALVLIAARHAFIKQPDERQRAWAIVIWAIHVAVFLVLLRFMK